MARAALALPSLLLFLAFVPMAEAAGSGVDLADGCVGPKLSGDQPVIARPYPGGGFEVFVGVDPSAVSAGSDGGLSQDGDDYVGVGAYALGPGCEVTTLLSSAT